ncbi:MAG TPA: bifunctional helix-turn-helix transcriptional regulator/GNAT family N-acetyltransferase [Candidatus Sulfotelmatobacter sp.]|jgi:DNA-binding MarR family transcriptional regulator/N-acetylglutamate synthase-like GNAT family acetyltransferase|nr:bifunctional helix-turn-helix transcriptional regulator/GNAT family N-acetyltransferase [Candidatus Sulfotelmatobacter sp.]
MIPRSRPTAAPHVSAVRRFNRFYTRQIGLLDEGLLNSPFSLTQVRTLYELAQREQATAIELCKDLGLDAGYLSRILASFQKNGLIEKKASPKDARHTLLTLTKKGRRAFEPLNARSDEQVGAMLAKLLPPKQHNLIQSMRTIESLLSPDYEHPKSYVLRQHRPGDIGWVVYRHGALYWQEYHYDERFEALVAEIVSNFVEHLDPARERCWIAEKEGENVGSVFLVKQSASVAKLRLLLVEPTARGLGIGKRLVEECMRFARKAGYRTIMLWTQSELSAARRIYQSAGFKLVEEKKHSSWSRTDLISETWQLKL